MKEIKDKTKEDKGIKINKGEWDGAPQNSYLFKMLEQNFSLNLLNFDEYDEEAN